MHLLALRFLSEADLILFPLCAALFYYITKAKANKAPSFQIRKLYIRAFYFRVFVVIFSTFITEFYFKGGDTGLYYQAVQDMRTAIADDIGFLWTSLTTSHLSVSSSLFNYFYYDNYQYDITYNYMISSHNFLAPRFALIPSYVFFNSYICINLFFSFFAFGGAVRLFKAFYYFYPKMYRELALACLFLPGVIFWSSSLLKDPISFGCMGYILNSLVNIIYRKRNYWGSVFLLIFCIYLLYVVKVYILLVLALGILIWMFAEVNKFIKDRTLRNIFTALSFVLSIGAGLLLLNYITTSENAQEYQLDTLLDNFEQERKGYAAIAEQLPGDSHFNINTSNPLLMAFSGITATFYRPFIWEINSPIVILSAIESSIFLLITIIFIVKRGVKKFLTIPFSDGRILMCFIFAFVFAAGIGSSTTNFGALSRYKIPCMPFYFVMILFMYRKTNLPYPKWFERLLNYTITK